MRYIVMPGGTAMPSQVNFAGEAVEEGAVGVYQSVFG